MKMPANEMASLAGASVRTKDYCHETILLKPESITPAGYRLYAEKDFLALRQVMSFLNPGYLPSNSRHSAAG
jgi:DNA-binding transcriptional MerR regulator